MMLSNVLTKPYYIFALFSILVGLLLVFIIPPIGVIDESQHIRRAADIAAFKLLDPKNDTEDPLAIWAENALVLQNERVVMLPRWDFWGMFDLLKKLPKTLPTDRQVMMDKNPFAVGNPVMYVPFAITLNLANYFFEFEPWQQFYLLRLTNLLFSVVLIAWAISRMPEHTIVLSALCLLPAMMNARSGVNVDGFVIGCTFLFISQFFILMRKQDKVNKKDVCLLVIFGFLMAQSKSAYVPLLFLSLLIPIKNFASLVNKSLVLCVSIVPAMITGLGWSAMARVEVLSGMRYFNDVGEVWPDGQFEWITHNVIDFILILLRTVFASPFIVHLFNEVVGYIGWGANVIIISPIAYLFIIVLMAAIMATEPVNKPLQQGAIKNCFLLGIMGSSIALALTMLYVQWSAYQAPIISGFQGRYMYPLIPLMVVFIKPTEKYINKKQSMRLLWIFGLISSASVLWATIQFYYL